MGGFLAKLSQAADLAECVRAGNWAARQIIQAPASAGEERGGGAIGGLTPADEL